MWPICHDLQKRRKSGEHDLYGVSVNRDVLYEALDYSALLSDPHGEPVTGQVPGSAEDLVPHVRLHLQVVDLFLEARNLSSEPRETLLKRPVPFAEPVHGQGILLVQEVELVGFLREALPFPEEGGKEFFPLGENFASLSQPGGDGFGRESELL